MEEDRGDLSETGGGEEVAAEEDNEEAGEEEVEVEGIDAISYGLYSCLISELRIQLQAKRTLLLASIGSGIS